MIPRCTSAVLAVLLSACGGGSDRIENPAETELPAVTDPVTGPNPAHDTELATEDVTITFFRSFEAGTYNFKSQAALASAWAAAPFRIYPVGIVLEEPPMPAYDFSRFSVVGLSLGVGKWCFKPRITRVVLKGNNDLVVDYFISTASTLACLRDGPLIAFALVPRFEGEVTFVENR